jgi:hypothetical protein
MAQAPICGCLTVVYDNCRPKTFCRSYPEGSAFGVNYSVIFSRSCIGTYITKQRNDASKSLIVFVSATLEAGVSSDCFFLHLTDDLLFLRLLCKL